jgi:hypothetical protein
MPKTIPSDIEAALDAIPPDAPVHDGAPWRRIIAARKTVADAENELRDAVADARANGYSWTVIGAALDTTRQAAYQRFGHRGSEAAEG